MAGIATESFEQVAIASAAALREWLEANHQRDDSVWLVTWKKSVPEKYVSTGDVLDELLAFGWIDGIRRKLDEDRTMQLVSRRKVQHWSKSYKDRVAKLTAEGRMHEAGLASVAAGKASGSWTFMEDVDALIVPPDLQTALDAGHTSAAFDDTPDAYRRNLLRWVKLAKTEATRNKRIVEIVDATAAGKRIPQM